MQPKSLQRVQVILLVLAMTVVSFFSFVIIFDNSVASAAPCEPRKSILGIPTWYRYLEGETDPSGRCNPVLSGSDTEGKVNSTLPIGVAILESVLRLAGLVAVVMIFWGGFKYITSQGNPDSAKGARSTVINAVIGLVIVMVSTIVVGFIGRSF